jgi:hypothetical protein
MNPTNLENAFDFSTTIPRNTTIQKPVFDKKCPFCSHEFSYPLVEEGSFRQCLRCKKQFQATLILQSPLPFNPTQHPLPQKHPNEFIMTNQKHLLENSNSKKTTIINANQNQSQYNIKTVQDYNYSQFSELNRK